MRLAASKLNSIWIATLEDARPVVEARGIYTPQRARFMPAGQYQDRAMLFAWVSQQPPGATTDITPYLPALRRLGVRVVVVRNPGAARRAIVGDPRAVDLSQVQDIGAYQMFLIGNAPPCMACSSRRGGVSASCSGRRRCH